MKPHTHTHFCATLGKPLPSPLRIVKCVVERTVGGWVSAKGFCSSESGAGSELCSQRI